MCSRVRSQWSSGKSERSEPQDGMEGSRLCKLDPTRQTYTRACSVQTRRETPPATGCLKSSESAGFSVLVAYEQYRDTRPHATCEGIAVSPWVTSDARRVLDRIWRSLKKKPGICARPLLTLTFLAATSDQDDGACWRRPVVRRCRKETQKLRNLDAQEGRAGHDVARARITCQKGRDVVGQTSHLQQHSIQRSGWSAPVSEA